MDGVRRIAYQIYRVLIAFIAIACVVQIFLAGRGVFGIHGAASLDDQKSLDPHRALGDVISLVAIVTFLLALLMWNKRLILYTFILAFLAVVIQHATALPKHPWVSGIHPVSGVAILGLGLARTQRVGRKEEGRSILGRDGRLRTNRHTIGSKDN